MKASAQKLLENDLDLKYYQRLPKRIKEHLQKAMYLGYSFTKWLLSLSALGLLLNAPVLAVHYADDKSDAWENVSKMIRFIENGDLPSTELAGNRAVGSIEKAIDGEKDQGKRDKLRDAVTEVKEALSNASRGSWPYAEAAAKRALKLLEEAR